MIDVSCIGILVADVIAKPVDAMPAPGMLERIGCIETYSGGCAMNAGIDMSKIGLDIAVLGKIGNDSFGAFLKEELIKNNVNVEGLSVDMNNQTSASVVLSASSGERSFLHCVGANATYDYDDVNFDVIEKSNIVFIAGTMLMDAFDGEVAAKVLKKSKEMGKLTVLDTAWDAKGRWMDVLRPCMPYIDVFLPSIDEAIQLAGGKTDLKEIADYFFDCGVGQVAIKNGKHGCYLRESASAEGVTIPSYTVKAVDTTGAGDSFCAGFITGLSKGFSFAECGRFANAVGAHCVSAMGASTGIKPMADILKFMEENK
ncbi:MAG: carbohydrate kinase family protein [Clostridia bacterium]|nr:carbohydrate kinase family protein [Clostridia bacterium]MBR2973285.1 carbohydrate kinase family protein [Clostridia bacterium]MBR3576086.1 carbohydrate kinase family protein [Clostridia bacterium]